MNKKARCLNEKNPSDSLYCEKLLAQFQKEGHLSVTLQGFISKKVTHMNNCRDNGLKDSAKSDNAYPGLSEHFETRKKEIANAEERNFERQKIRGKVAHLSAERVKAQLDGDEKRVDKITAEIRQIVHEIKKRFGY